MKKTVNKKEKKKKEECTCGPFKNNNYLSHGQSHTAFGEFVSNSGDQMLLCEEQLIMAHVTVPT